MIVEDFLVFGLRLGPHVATMPAANSMLGIEVAGMSAEVIQEIAIGSRILLRVALEVDERFDVSLDFVR